MSQVFVGYDTYSIEGVNEEFIHFIFDVTLGSASLRFSEDSPGSANKLMESEVGLILADNAKMRSLNQRYRGKDRPTNVLSFTNQEIAGGAQVESDEHYLGDIYIGVTVLADESKELKISEKERFAQLFVHGLLHLLGWDHEKPAEAVEMEALEDKIVQLVV